TTAGSCASSPTTSTTSTRGSTASARIIRGMPRATVKPTLADLGALRASLDEAQLAAVARHAAVRTLARGEPFLAAGDRATLCGTIIEGVLREYFPLADGREVTRGFAGPGDPIGSLSDLLLDEPARSCVVAETPARITVLQWI